MRTSNDEAIRQAIAIVKMEGYEFSEQTMALLDLYASGQITITELVNIIQGRNKDGLSG